MYLSCARVFFALFFLLERLVDGIVDQRGGSFFAFLTNWGVLLTGGSMMLAGVVGLMDWRDAAQPAGESDALAASSAGGTAVGTEKVRRPSTATEDKKLSCVDCRRTAVMCNELWLPMELIITAMFWALLFDPVVSHKTPADTFSNITIHALCFVAAITDSIFGRFSLYLIHTWLATVIAVIYVIWNLAWTLIDGEPVYSILDWSGNTGTSVTIAIGTMVATHVAFVLFWAWTYHVRDQMLGANPRPAMAEPLPTGEPSPAPAVELTPRHAAGEP